MNITRCQFCSHCSPTCSMNTPHSYYKYGRSEKHLEKVNTWPTDFYCNKKHIPVYVDMSSSCPHFDGMDKMPVDVKRVIEARERLYQ